MLKITSIAVLASALFAGSAFAGTLNMQNPNMRFENATPNLTQLDSSFVRVGKPVTVDLVRQITVGAQQGQIETLLGKPVSVSKRGRSSIWDYNLEFNTAKYGEIICQYKVIFDNSQKVDDTVWRRPQCQQIMSSR